MHNSYKSVSQPVSQSVSHDVWTLQNSMQLHPISGSSPRSFDPRVSEHFAARSVLTHAGASPTLALSWGFVDSHRRNFGISDSLDIADNLHIATSDTDRTHTHTRTRIIKPSARHRAPAHRRALPRRPPNRIVSPRLKDEQNITRRVEGVWRSSEPYFVRYSSHSARCFRSPASVLH